VLEAKMMPPNFPAIFLGCDPIGTMRQFRAVRQRQLRFAVEMRRD
jgi:hypothetical protein